MSSTPTTAPGYTGLTELTQGLPAEAYFDPLRYERELQRIWYRNWIYVGRSSEIAAKRAFRTFQIGDQKILLVRDDAGQSAGLSQYLPSSRRGAVPRERGVAAHRLPSSVPITPGCTASRANCCAPPPKRSRKGSISPTIRFTGCGCSSGAASCSYALREIRRRSSGNSICP